MSFQLSLFLASCSEEIIWFLEASSNRLFESIFDEDTEYSAPYGFSCALQFSEYFQRRAVSAQPFGSCVSRRFFV